MPLPYTLLNLVYHIFSDLSEVNIYECLEIDHIWSCHLLMSLFPFPFKRSMLNLLPMDGQELKKNPNWMNLLLGSNIL